jgi:hypothetical protein
MYQPIGDDKKMKAIICGYICVAILFGLILLASSYSAIDPETAVAVWLFDEGEGDEVMDETNNPAKLMGLLQGRKISYRSLFLCPTRTLG